ncbi:phage tail assembly chaperone [Brevundimonas variabilis]|uniref:Putative phage protein (TIGR02216 family) n=1 Tax=Brevundimonas variabilis TaxID=74312 RepID=A0A7W9FF28_9CAUL|nr:phage tail assembly chaperone [Brevundimonas variabilis]MBB5746890.1 putative phage protein (TIGR02216 family) [Brevundimonas variabilis]
MMDWAGMLQAGVRTGVAPEAVWRLSLKEWRMLTAEVGGAGPPGRAVLEQMARQWPDTDAARATGGIE